MGGGGGSAQTLDHRVSEFNVHDFCRFCNLTFETGSLREVRTH